ncbi:MAG: GntR family transcriptional regulator [Trueperaceae bacterium]
MSISRDNPLPLYHQLRELFLAEISNGRWQVGGVIPSEIQLAKGFGVSRATVRQALLELVQTNHLRRIQGKGTIVTEPKVEPLGALTSFTENMKAAGITPTRTTFFAEWRRPPPAIAKALPSSKNRAYYVERLLIAESIPLGLQRAWYPDWLISGNESYFSRKSLDKNSLYELLQIHCGITLDTAEETIDVLMPAANDAKLLDLAPDQPIMLIQRDTFDPSDRLIESVELLFRSDRYRYRVILSRSQRTGGGR